MPLVVIQANVAVSRHLIHSRTKTDSYHGFPILQRYQDEVSAITCKQNFPNKIPLEKPPLMKDQSHSLQNYGDVFINRLKFLWLMGPSFQAWGTSFKACTFYCGKTCLERPQPCMQDNLSVKDHMFLAEELTYISGN